MALIFEPLNKSLILLEQALAFYGSTDRMRLLEYEVQDMIRAAVIQSFEVAYECSWKAMQRWLRHNGTPHIGEGNTRRHLFRICAEQSLIDDVDQWMLFHESRNLSSHTYSQDTAISVAATAQAFLLEAKKVLVRLETRND